MPEIQPDYSIIFKRYADAYKVAGSLVTTGKTVKAVALYLAIGIVTFFITERLDGASLIEEIAWGAGALATLGLGFGIGTHFTANGQFALSILDTAVNTSPFLDEKMKYEMLRDSEDNSRSLIPSPF